MRWMCRDCHHINLEEDGPICENCDADNSMAPADGSSVSPSEREIEAVARALATYAAQGDQWEAARIWNAPATS